MAGRPDITDGWPEKYGRLDQDVEGRSGLSPTEISFPTVPGGDKDAIAVQLDARREEYQRGQFFGFTVRDFVDLDVRTERNLKKGDLPAAIHPVFARDRWMGAPDCPHIGPVFELPEGQGLSGNWEAKNDIVWNAMLPSLKIVTQLMSKIYEIPWFLAMVNSPKSPISESRKRNIHKSLKLLQYDLLGTLTPQQASDARDKLQRIVAKMSSYDYENVTLAIKDSGIDPLTGSPEPNRSFAFTTTYDEMVYIFVDSDLIVGLLRDDLNDCEKMGMEFFLANTLLHEFSHALWQVVRKADMIGIADEPYFRNDAIAEAGYTMELQSFTAIVQPMIWEPLQPMFGLWLETDDQTFGFTARTTGPILKNPELSTIQRYYPVKASFFQNIQQKEFWTVGIRAFGLSILHVSSLKEGVEVDWEGTIYKYNIVKRVPIPRNPRRINQVIYDVNSQRQRILSTLKTKGSQMTPEERVNYQFGKNAAQNAIWDDLFWERQQHLQEYKRSVVASLEYTISGRTREDRRAILDNLLLFLKNTTREHLRIIDILLRAETNQGIRFDERHDDLMIWNRGQRIYAKELLALAKTDPDYLNFGALEDALIGLDVCRMLLWHPAEPSDLEGTERENFALLQLETQRLNQQWADVQSSCNEMFGRADCSVYAIACASIVLSHIPEQVQGLQTSFDYAMKGYGLLERLSRELQLVSDLGITAYANWAPHLRQWMQSSTDRQNSIRARASVLGARVN